MERPEPPAGFLDALEAPPPPEQLPVGFHLLQPHAPRRARHPWGESVPHRARRTAPEPPPKPTSRCFPR